MFMLVMSVMRFFLLQVVQCRPGSEHRMSLLSSQDDTFIENYFDSVYFIECPLFSLFLCGPLNVLFESTVLLQTHKPAKRLFIF